MYTMTSRHATITFTIFKLMSFKHYFISKIKAVFFLSGLNIGVQGED